MVRRLLRLSLVLLVGFGAFAQNPEDVLMKADRDFCRDVAAKRLDGWMAWMAPNVVRFGGAASKGLEEVRASMKEAFNDPDFRLEWEPTKAELFPSGTMGFTVGRFTIHDKGIAGPTETKGTYLTVWEKQKDGTWKVVADGGGPDRPVWKE